MSEFIACTPVQRKSTETRLRRLRSGARFAPRTASSGSGQRSVVPDHGNEQEYRDDRERRHTQPFEQQESDHGSTDVRERTDRRGADGVVQRGAEDADALDAFDACPALIAPRYAASANSGPGRACAAPGRPAATARRPVRRQTPGRRSGRRCRPAQRDCAAWRRRAAGVPRRSRSPHDAGRDTFGAPCSTPPGQRRRPR